MAFKLWSIISLVALATVASAAPRPTVCSDGTVVPDSVCCEFIPVSRAVAVLCYLTLKYYSM